MTIKKNVIAVIMAIIAVALILFSLFNSSLLIYGDWERQMTKDEQNTYKEETGTEFKPSEHKMTFETSGKMTKVEAGEKTELTYVVNTTNSDTLFSYNEDDSFCTLIKVKDNTLTTYDFWSDYFDGTNGVEYKRVSGLSLAWIVRIIGIVVFLGAVAVFLFVKNIVIPMPTIAYKSIISGIMAVIAIVLVVFTFISEPILLCGTWVPDYNKEQKEEFELLNGFAFKEENATISYNFYNTAFEKYGDETILITGYNYLLDGSTMYRINLMDNDETKGYDYDGGLIEKKKFKVDEDSLYLYEEGQKPAEGTKFKRVGLSLVWLMRIIAILFLGGAALVFFLYKPNPKKFVTKAAKTAPAADAQ